jgi:hypothetical protein
MGKAKGRDGRRLRDVNIESEYLEVERRRWHEQIRRERKLLTPLEISERKFVTPLPTSVEEPTDQALDQALEEAFEGLIGKGWRVTREEGE